MFSVVEASPERIIAFLDRGQIDVDIALRSTRVFRVLAGPVVIDALDAVFVVERKNERSGVSVRQGRVRATWNSRSQEIGTGEMRSFPPGSDIAAPGTP